MMEGGFKHVSALSLECPICLDTFRDAKILSCSHTFCRACLDNLLDCHGIKQKLRCPVCRADTQVFDHDVSQLQTNLALMSLIGDIDNYHQHHECTNCKSEDRPNALVYCKDCGKYLCTSCNTKHSQWEGFSDHEVLAISGIASGTVPVQSQRYRKCKKHPREDEDCFCSDCRIFACFRCVIMEHKDEGHHIIEESVYKRNHLKSLEDLKSKAEKTRSYIQKYVDFIDEQKNLVNTVKKQCIDDISEAYDESVRQLTTRAEFLIGEVNSQTTEADTELCKMKKEAQQQISHMMTLTDLVANGTKIPSQTDAVAAHDTLFQELRDSMKLDDPSFKRPKTSSKKGKLLVFERNVGVNKLGEVMHSVAKNVALPFKERAMSMAATPDGMMAVGCHKGGIGMFSTDGQFQQTAVLKKIYIDSLSILSDGRHVVRDLNNITLYSTECEKLDVQFETLDYIECGRGGLDVDSNDHIYVGYTDAKKIQVFSPEGGKAIREIPCFGIEPMQVTVFDDLLMIKHRKTISMVDVDGDVKHRTIKENLYPSAAVTQDNRILIAWLNHVEGSVRIDEYNKKLQHVTNIISDYKVDKPVSGSYNLREFRSGELAFCTPKKLYIFH